MMKKTSFLLTMALVLLLLSACGGTPAEDAPFEWPENPNVEQKNDSLKIYAMSVGKGSWMLKRAVEVFRASHPGVAIELTLEDFNGGQGYDAYGQVAAEIMAGKGPDVILIDDNPIDVEKLVRQGIFADMEPFFEADGFDWEPYNQTIMDGGVWDGHRYVIPLSYNIPVLFSTRTALEQSGFSVEACGDFGGFMEETTRFLEDPALPLFRFPLGVTAFFEQRAGIQIADYSARTVDLSAPELKTALQWVKTVLERNPDDFVLYNESALYGAADVRDGKVLWVGPDRALESFYTEYAALKTVGEAVMMPIRDLHGGIRAHIQYPLAVRANSENLQNAYDFIKTVLSPEVQGYVSQQELSVLNAVNYEFFRETVQGHYWHVLPGTNGFYSTTNETESIDWPTEAEFEEFMGYVGEISGTYYYSDLRLRGKMQPFLYEGADYDETLKAAKRAIELYLSE